jgi:hypothetical protein
MITFQKWFQLFSSEPFHVQYKNVKMKISYIFLILLFLSLFFICMKLELPTYETNIQKVSETQGTMLKAYSVHKNNENVNMGHWTLRFRAMARKIAWL